MEERSEQAPVFLLGVFEESFEFVYPLCCEPAHDHILDGLYHFSLFTTLPPREHQHILSIQKTQPSQTASSKAMCQTTLCVLQQIRTFQTKDHWPLVAQCKCELNKSCLWADGKSLKCDRPNNNTIKQIPI